MTITYKKQEREKQVKEGIDFLLSHFEVRQRLFPRKMSTSTSQGKQFIVYNKEQILFACIKSNFYRLSAKCLSNFRRWPIASSKFNIH